eukprot:14761888-Alexandrium_andersonii.AAC.1
MATARSTGWRRPSRGWRTSGGPSSERTGQRPGRMGCPMSSSTLAATSLPSWWAKPSMPAGWVTTGWR